MFGIFRTTLAFMVMAYHLFVQVLPMGAYAVFGFYIISGYLMTLIMHESYGYSVQGRGRFLLNRFLRLYPQYWAAVGFSFLLIYLVGQEWVKEFHPSIFVPETTEGFLYNLFMIFPAWRPNELEPRLVPPTWSLTVELLFYLLICLGLSKTLGRVKVWLALSLAYFVVSALAGMPWEDRYYPAAAASLPFAIGALIYFLSRDEKVRQAYLAKRFSPKVLFGLFLGNCLFWMLMKKFGVGDLSEIGMYFNIVICAFIVYSIAVGKELFRIDRKLDKFIGDFSYPVYLLHWQSGLVASYLIFQEPAFGRSPSGLVVLSGAVVFILIMSYLFMVFIDHPVQVVRRYIKSRNTPMVAKEAPVQS